MRVIQRTQKEVYKLWVKALRSGKYKQGTHRLRTDNDFCCLGVLCDLAAKDGGRQWEEKRIMAFIYDKHDVALPKKMAQWMGLDKGGQDALMSLNDGGSTFHQIADEIEEIAKQKGY